MIKILYVIYLISILRQTEPLTIHLNKEQIIIFENSTDYTVEMFTKCNNKIFSGKSISIENISIRNILS